MCTSVIHQDWKKETKAHNEQRDAGYWIKQFFNYCHSYCFRQTSCGAGSTEWFKQVNATADLQTNLSDNNKQQRRCEKKKQEQRLATINILEKTSEVKKGVHSAFLIVNSVSTSSWTR